jgi:hypothetical protein
MVAVAVGVGSVVAPAPEAAPMAVPTVQIHAVQLAGIGQNIYNAITPVVQYVVGGVSYLVNFTPLIGGPIAAQININYFQGIQPAVAATVDYGAALVHAPLDFVPITGAYVDDLVGIGYDLVSAELRFFGFQELPPRPAAATPRPIAPAAAQTAPAAPAAAGDAAPGEQSELALTEEPALLSPDRRPSRSRGQARPDAAAEPEPDATFGVTTAEESRRESAAEPTRRSRGPARSAARAAN